MREIEEDSEKMDRTKKKSHLRDSLDYQGASTYQTIAL